ncbi:tail fiber domain-containing protein [Stenotrophomonas maltophilia]|uniref:tail fiber domain-containing protein n=1 Tax=Stenotrophomonas maltophilia TaxID=40324 RepID=UPI004042C362
MFTLANTTGASAITPPTGKTTLFIDATGIPSTKDSGGTVTSFLTAEAADSAYQPLDADLTGIAGLTYAADKSIYYNGTAWATYDLTSVGRTLLAATTQAAQRTAIQAVGLVGAENVAGVKTYTDNGVWVVNADGSRAIIQSFGGNPTISFYKGDFVAGTATRSMFIGAANQFRVGASAAADNSAPTTFIDFLSNQVRPSADNLFSLGTGSLRFSNLYVVNAPIVGSDGRFKTEPRKLSDAERKAGSALARSSCIWEWLAGDRLHIGPTVQAAIAIMEAHGLDPFGYSFICYDKWKAEPATYDDDGNELTAAIAAGDRYGFRDKELICFMVSALAAENDAQAAKVEALDARLAALEVKG